MIRILFFTLFFISRLSQSNAQVKDSSFGVYGSFAGGYPSVTACDFGGPATRDDRSFLTVHLADGRMILAGDTRGSDGSDFAIARLMPDGQYDQSAGPNGQVRIDLGYPNDSCLAAARYGADRILMAGCVWPTGASKYVNLMARIDLDGKLDTAFGLNGHLTFDLPSAHEMITEVWTLPNGKTIIAGNSLYGSSFDFPDSTNMFIGRLMPNGKVDSTFGTNGFIYAHWEQYCNAALVSDLSVDDSGRIVIAGASYDPYPQNYGGDDFCFHNLFLRRYLPDGEPDETFGINGALQLEQTKYSRGNSLIHYPDGRILLAGAAGDPLLGEPTYAFLARFMPDGKPDLSFGTNGRFRKSIIMPGLFSGGFIEPLRLLRMRNRILVMSGFDIPFPVLGFGALCLTEEGMIDSTFGTNGLFNVIPEFPLEVQMNHITTTSNNNFFITGYYSTLFPYNMCIFKIKWDEASNTDENLIQNNLSLYPNPAQDGYFQINPPETEMISQNFTLKVRYLSGGTVHEVKGDQAFRGISTIGWPSGLYIIELNGERRNYIGRVVVANR